MAGPRGPYQYYIVENFVPASTAGRHGQIHTRPTPNQGVSTRLYVQGPAGLKKHPPGTKFRIRAKVSRHKGNAKYLKSYYSWPFKIVDRPKRRLHIVQSDARIDRKELENAAQRHGNISKWIVPKSAAPGDYVVIFIGGLGFFATGLINSPTASRSDWKKRYAAGLTKITLIDPPISLPTIRRHIPKLLWAKYPRNVHTPKELIAKQIQRLIADRQLSRVPDLDNNALDGANIEELRRVALLKAQKRVRGIKATTINRARSRAIHLYVLRRANGRCEGCEASAPFRKPDGSPYLEPHHVTRLADEGPDHPARVIALCPNCHRRAHSAEDKNAFNRRLRNTLQRIEAKLSKG